MKNKAFKLSNSFAESASSSGAALARFWDTGQPGLLLRVTGNGAKTWCVAHRPAGIVKKVEAKIGRFPAMRVEAARLEAARVIVSGCDPVEEKKAAKREALRLKDETFEALASKFIDAKRAALAAGDLREKTLDGYEGLLERYVLPQLGSKPYGQMRRLDVRQAQQAILDGVSRANSTGGTTARHALTLISMIFNWGLDEELVEFNPAERVKPLAKPKTRERILSEVELKAIWRVLSTVDGREEVSVGNAVSIALRLCLLTMLRRASVVGLHPSEVDMENSLWLVPASRMKSKRAFVVPLSETAKALVKEGLGLNAKKRRGSKLGGSLFAFPAKDGEGAMDPAALTRAMSRICTKLDIPSAGPHDLRRTGRTLLTSERVGVSFEIAERCLDHDIGNAASRAYDMNAYLAEKRRAFDALNREIERVVAAPPSVEVAKAA